MSESVISGIEPSDVLGGAMFAVGAAVLLNLVDAPGVIGSPTVGVVLMVLGVGAVYGRETFVELVKELLLSNDKKGGDSETDDETSGSEDDETDDGEVGIDRPPGEEVTTET